MISARFLKARDLRAAYGCLDRENIRTRPGKPSSALPRTPFAIAMKGVQTFNILNPLAEGIDVR